MRVWANDTDDNSRHVHLTFWTYKWNFAGCGIISSSEVGGIMGRTICKQMNKL